MSMSILPAGRGVVPPPGRHAEDRRGRPAGQPGQVCRDSRQAVGRRPRPGRTRSHTTFDTYARSVSQHLRLLGSLLFPKKVCFLGENKKKSRNNRK